MRAHPLAPGFTFVIALVLSITALNPASVSAAETSQWSDTLARSNMLVQDCHSPSVLSGLSPNLAYGLQFAVTTSYRIDREFTLITDQSGINHPAIERSVFSVTGVVSNSATGLSLAYDGQFTRTKVANESEASITDAVLHLVAPNQRHVTVTVTRDSSGVIDSPEAMLLAYAPHALDSSLCLYFADLSVAGE